MCALKRKGRHSVQLDRPILLKKSESRTRAEAGFEEPPIFAEVVWPRHSDAELSTPKPAVFALEGDDDDT
jgi:hypothetical protein